MPALSDSLAQVALEGRVGRDRAIPLTGLYRGLGDENVAPGEHGYRLNVAGAVGGQDQRARITRAQVSSLFNDASIATRKMLIGEGNRVKNIATDPGTGEVVVTLGHRRKPGAFSFRAPREVDSEQRFAPEDFNELVNVAAEAAQARGALQNPAAQEYLGRRYQRAIDVTPDTPETEIAALAADEARLADPATAEGILQERGVQSLDDLNVLDEDELRAVTEAMITSQGLTGSNAAQFRDRMFAAAGKSVTGADLGLSLEQLKFKAQREDEAYDRAVIERQYEDERKAAAAARTREQLDAILAPSRGEFDEAYGQMQQVLAEYARGTTDEDVTSRVLAQQARRLGRAYGRLEGEFRPLVSDQAYAALEEVVHHAFFEEQGLWDNVKVLLPKRSELESSQIIPRLRLSGDGSHIAIDDPAGGGVYRAKMSVAKFMRLIPKAFHSEIRQQLEQKERFDKKTFEPSDEKKKLTIAKAATMDALDPRAPDAGRQATRRAATQVREFFATKRPGGTVRGNPRPRNLAEAATGR